MKTMLRFLPAPCALAVALGWLLLDGSVGRAQVGFGGGGFGGGLGGGGLGGGGLGGGGLGGLGDRKSVV